MEILLNKSISKKSVNINNSLAIDLKNSKRALPIDDLRTTLSELDLYNYERKNSNKIRLTLTVNTICSNVLFNPFTEIVKNEGSNKCICLNFIGINEFGTTIKDKITSSGATLVCKAYSAFTSMIDCIRDTQLSNVDNGCVYHCGTDIFNNHILRSNTFKTPCLLFSTNGDLGTNTLFNTIGDALRTNDGITISGHTDTSTDDTLIPLHLYLSEDILSFKDCISERLDEENGWFGFTNRSVFPIYKEKVINRVINNRNSCEFIDMYPSRDLFFFTPKYNSNRKRIEKNWNYALTYPYSSTTENIPFIYKGGLLIDQFSNDVKSNNGIKSFKLTSLSKHGLKKGDIINLYSYTNGKVLENVEILNIEDEYVFSTFNNDIIIDKDDTLYFKKVVEYEEVEYYVRLFKKLSDKDYDNHIGKLAFSKNIYKDDIAEIIYSDDIDINGLYDNLGRPLSSIYFTVLKNNAGCKDWYSGITSGDTIEYSHCFSEVTCGFEYNNTYHDDYNNGNIKYDIKSLHNTSKTIVNSLNSSEITIDDDIFYGDLCCYSNSKVMETVIQPICYRFNTYQREYLPFGNEIKYDEITSDDYDSIGFTINDKPIESTKIQSYKTLTLVNKNEGYYYYPHFEIPIKTFSNNINTQKPIFLTIKNLIYKNKSELFLVFDNSLVNCDLYEFYTYENHDLLLNDVLDIKIYDTETQSNIYKVGTIIEIINNKRFIIAFKATDNVKLLNENRRNYKLLKRDPNIPSYATLTKRDSSMYSWRDIIENGFDNESSVESYPFTNGALYIHKNINLFVKRQDPENHGGIKDKDVESNVLPTLNENNYYNEEEITC